MSRILGLVWACAFLVGCGAGPPTDRQLVEHFRTHRGDYEKVLPVLSQEPVITRVEFADDSGSVRVDTMPGGIDTERRQSLVSFYRRTSVSVINAGPSEGPISSVAFFNYRSGIIGSGSVKGIRFEVDPKFITKESGAILSRDCLDKYTPPGGPFKKTDGIVYCKIEEHWYLFLSR